MSCPEPELLSAFADGELDASGTAEIERHLSGCASCRSFVEEMRWVDAFGRTALRAIPVAPRRVSARVIPTGRWFWRPLALAAAAVLLIGLSITAWYVPGRWGDRRSRLASGASTPIPAEIRRPLSTNTVEVRTGGQFLGSSDEAFERWARPYRRLRIPLIPLENVATYEPPPTPPVRAAPATRDGAG